MRVAHRAVVVERRADRSRRRASRPACSGCCPPRPAGALAFTISAAGASHARNGFRSDSAQRCRRSGWNCRRSLGASASLDVACTSGCTNSSYARWLKSRDRRHRLERLLVVALEAVEPRRDVLQPALLERHLVRRRRRRGPCAPRCCIAYRPGGSASIDFSTERSAHAPSSRPCRRRRCRGGRRPGA